MSEVPHTLDELKVELGKDMLLYALDAYGQVNEKAQHLIVVAPSAHHVAAVEDWRAANPDAVKAIGAVARRALSELPRGVDNVLISIMSDLSTDLGGVRGVLSSEARYITHILGVLPTQSAEDIEKCLVAIVAFSNGE